MGRWIVDALGGIPSDLDLGWRRLRRRPAFLALFALALGPATGALAGMLELSDAAFLKPAAGVRASSQLRRWVIRERGPQGQVTTRDVMTFTEFQAVRGALTDMPTTMFAAPEAVTLGTERGPTIRVESVASNYFVVLGVTPVLGNVAGFGTGPGSGDIVLSERIWRDEFNGRRQVLGSPVRLQGRLYTVRAIAPPGFIGVGLQAADAWVGTDEFMRTDVGPNWQMNSGYIFGVVTRIHGRTPGALEARVGAALQEVTGRSTQLRPELVAFSAARLSEGGSQAKLGLLLLALSVLVGAFATTTGTALFLARVTERRHETAIMSAVGGSPARIAAQVVGECMLAGAAAALLAGAVMFIVVRAGGPVVFAGFDVSRKLGLGRPIVIFLAAMGLVLVVSSAFSARSTQRKDLLQALSGGAVTERNALRTHGGLLSAQAGLAFLFVLVSLLYLASLRRIMATPMGVEPERFVFGQISPKNSTNALLVGTGIRASVAAVRGVGRTSLAQAVPLYSNNLTISLSPNGQVPVEINGVDTSYFATVGTPVVQGRGFTPGDVEGAPSVAVVNTVLAKAYWPNTSPLGKCVRIAPPPFPCRVVVGVAEATRRMSLTQPAFPQVYVPLSQRGIPGPLFVLARFTAGAVPLEALDRAAGRADGAPPGFAFHTLDRYIAPQLRPWRTGALVSSIIAALSVLCTVLALYAIASRVVEQRTKELALRRALGAHAWALATIVLLRVLAPVVLGVAVAVPFAMAAAPRIASLLYATSPQDPWIWGAAMMIVMLAGMLAAFVPAVRAARTDPASILRA